MLAVLVCLLRDDFGTAMRPRHSQRTGTRA
jgi:hypothetical protein